MKSEKEVKRLHRRLESFVTHASRATSIPFTFGMLCVCVYIITFDWTPEEFAAYGLPGDLFWLVLGSFSFGLAFSIFFLIALKRLVVNSKTEWEEDHTFESPF